MYNLTNLTNATNIYEVMKGANEVTSGMYGLLLIVAIYLIMFVTMKKYDTVVVLMVSSFITGIIAVPLFFIGLVGWVSIITPIVLLVGGIIWFINDR